MSWEAATEYTALIGGILYRNVSQPIVCNGKSLISLNRDTRTYQLGVTLELFQEDRSPIASVTNNAVTLHNDTDYVLLESLNRTAVAHKQTGRLWFDLKWKHRNRTDSELSMSCILFHEGGYPIFLHPDRSKFGRANDNKPPNISLLTLTTDPVNTAGAILLDNDSFYLLGMTIENYHIGVDIKYRPENATK